MSDTLRSIIEKWRAGAQSQSFPTPSHVFRSCAAELEALLAEYEKVDLVKRWPESGRGLTSEVQQKCADELETWLAVNLERIKVEARLEGRRASLDYVSGVIVGRRKFGADEVLKGCVEEEYERIAALEAQAKEKP